MEKIIPHNGYPCSVRIHLPGLASSIDPLLLKYIEDKESYLRKQDEEFERLMIEQHLRMMDLFLGREESEIFTHYEDESVPKIPPST